MELPAVGVRVHRFEPPQGATREDAGARGHSWWQRLQRRSLCIVAGFAIPYGVCWHSSARVKAPLDEGQCACRGSGRRLVAQIALFGKDPP
jgi:hypothetical protein